MTELGVWLVAAALVALGGGGLYLRSWLEDRERR